MQIQLNALPIDIVILLEIIENWQISMQRQHYYR